MGGSYRPTTRIGFGSQPSTLRGSSRRAGSSRFWIKRAKCASATGGARLRKRAEVLDCEM